MKYLKYILPLFIFLLLSGCGEVVNYIPSKSIPRDGVIAVFPFQNNTNTPFAGQKMKNITINILLSKDYFVRGVSLKDEDEYLTENKVMKLSKSLPTKYYLFGSVNEYRYKSGIEAEPAVAVSFKIVEKDTQNVVYSAVGAKNGWGSESLGSISQKLIWELVDR